MFQWAFLEPESNFIEVNIAQEEAGKTVLKSLKVLSSEIDPAESRLIR